MTTAARPREQAPKRARTRLAHAELLQEVAYQVHCWNLYLTDPKRAGVRPVDEWPADDPLRRLMRVYGLTAEDLARLCDGLAGQLEGRAERAGIAEAWEPT